MWNVCKGCFPYRQYINVFRFVFQHFDLYPNTAYAAHYVYFTIWISNHTSSRSTWFSSGVRCYDPCRMICTRTRQYVNTRRAPLRSITVLIKPFFIINVALGTIPLGARESKEISINLLSLYFQWARLQYYTIQYAVYDSSGDY